LTNGIDTSNVGKVQGGESQLSEVAFLEVSPGCDIPTFLGSWSSYPYYPSGNVVVNTIERGLFIVKVNL
jgi:hypothetical protein